jgi:hypothetical protein
MRRLLLVIGALGTLQASAASIDIASPGNLSATQSYVTSGGVFIGPYTLDINGTTSLALCVDYEHWSEVGVPWESFQTPIAATGMNNTYVYQANAKNPNVDAITFQIYEEEAFLYRQIVSNLLPGDRTAMQEAAWSVTYTGFDITDDPEAQLWAAVARNPVNYQHVDLTGLYVFSDVHGSKRGEQEFMSDPVGSVPEPASLGVLAGLLGITCGRLRHRSRHGGPSAA